MSTVWLFEKPSQANDVATAVGIIGKRNGCIETKLGIFTWGFGHLLEQLQPDDYDAAHKAWRLDTLPIVPERWRVRPASARAGQLKIVCELIKAASEVVIATDADREGECIGREILDHAKYRGPTKRLWLSALDPVSVRRAVGALRDGKSTAPLYWAAQARSRADWLVGMNLTRAATLIAQAGGAQGVRSVGRVQTPTLALVVRRDAEIAAFVPRDYFEIEADVNASGQSLVMKYAPGGENRLFERATAEEIAQRVIGAEGPLQVQTERKRQSPPKLMSLKDLQKACSKKFGFGADKTLEVAQSLYETHKILSYPRSDCSYMPNEQEADVGPILTHLAQLDVLGGPAQKAAAQPVVRKSVFDSSKTTAHHAIVPTLVPARLDALSPDERRVYLLVAQHYIASLSPDYVYDETKAALDANGIPLTAVGRTPITAGWKSVFGNQKDDEDDDKASLPSIPNGTRSQVMTARVEGKRTEPPKQYTEGTLIDDMNSIAKFCTDPRVKARLKETSGIGTSATQGNIIKTLRDRSFIAPVGKNTIVSTPAGRALIGFLPDELCDPALTALWEDRLSELAEGKLPEAAREEFVDRVLQQVNRLLGEMRTAPAPDMSGEAGSNGRSARSTRSPAANRGGGRSRGSAPAKRVESDRTSTARDGAPTDKMLAYAQKIAESRGLKKPPDSIRTSFEACRKFIDEHGTELTKQRESGRPSDRQLQFAQNLANRMGLALPAGCFTSSDDCRRFIDVHNPGTASRGPTRR